MDCDVAASTFARPDPFPVRKTEVGAPVSCQGRLPSVGRGFSQGPGRRGGQGAGWGPFQVIIRASSGASSGWRSEPRLPRRARDGRGRARMISARPTSRSAFVGERVCGRLRSKLTDPVRVGQGGHLPVGVPVPSSLNLNESIHEETAEESDDARWAGGAALSLVCTVAHAPSDRPTRWMPPEWPADDRGRRPHRCGLRYPVALPRQRARDRGRNGAVVDPCSWLQQARSRGPPRRRGERGQGLRVPWD